MLPWYPGWSDGHQMTQLMQSAAKPAVSWLDMAKQAVSLLWRSLHILQVMEHGHGTFPTCHVAASQEK